MTKHLRKLMNKRTIVVLLLIGAVFFYLSGGFKKEHASDSLTSSTPVKRFELSAKAELRPANEGYAVVIKGGRLDRILKPAGTEVKENEILAVVDETERKTQLESALSRFKLAKINYERIGRLYRSGATSREEYDEANSTFTVRTAELKAAKQELNNSLVRSPLDGTVAMVAYTIGDVTPDGARVAIVEDRKNYHLRLSLPRKDQKALGDKVTVKLPAALGEVEGDLRVLNEIGEGPADAIVEFKAEIPDQYVGRWVDVTLKGREANAASLQSRFSPAD
ncbi:MAG: HlyD family efflux transporter periplasmic adaptor subunit [Bdellovibrionota bacterium]